MRASSMLAQLAVCAAALSAAGCAAGGAPPATPHVNVAISAPTSGATVGVHKVTITGTVSPAGAQVVVNGQPAKVTGSSFTGTMYVSAANEKIVVSAAAHGYVASQTSATVTYSPSVAQQLVAAAAAVNQPAADSSSATPKVTTSVLTQAFGLSVASVAKSSPTNKTASARGTPPAPVAPSSPAGGSSTPAPGSNSSASSSGAPAAPPSSSATPAPPPAPTPAEIAAAIHDAWVHGCIRLRSGGSAQAYCTCTYNHLAGQLQTRAAAEQVLKEMVPYLRSGDFRTVPAFIRHAVDACISKLPPLDPVTGKPVVSAFPGGTPAAPASNQGSQSAPATTTPVYPAPLPPSAVATTPTTPAPSGPAASSTTTSAPSATTAVASVLAAFKQLGSTLTLEPPTSMSPAKAGAVRQAHRGAAGSGITPKGGHPRLAEARVIAKALSYALVWVGNHDQTGPYPYWYRVQRRLYRHLSAALKLAA